MINQASSLKVITLFSYTMLKNDRASNFSEFADQICEFFSGYENAEKCKNSICLILTKIPKSQLSTNTDVIREQIRQDFLDDDEDTTVEWTDAKWKKKIDTRLLKAIEQNKSFFQSNKPIPNLQGIQSFISNLSQKNKHVTIFDQNIVFYDPILEHTNYERSSREEIVQHILDMPSVDHSICKDMFDCSKVVEQDYNYLITMVDEISIQARDLLENNKFDEVNKIIQHLQIIKNLNLIDNIQTKLTIDKEVVD